LITETLPTVGLVTGGGAEVLKEAQPYAQNMIDAFNQIGVTPAPTTTPPRASAMASPTTVPTEAHGQVDVNVLNASAVTGIAHTTATALSAQGFHVGQVGDATSPLAPGSPSQILYGPSGREAALTLASVLSGPVTMATDPSLGGQTVSLLIAGSQLAVTGSPVGRAATAGTSPGPTTTTTTTIPADVYANTQLEPWNPFPCTPGQATQASPRTTTTRQKKG
jgi:hypothetical protein